MILKGKVERKQYESEVMDVDTTGRKVVVAMASTLEIDRDDDIFEPTAFNRTIAERGPNGTKEIWHLLDHEGGIREGALSKPSEIYMKDGKLVFVTPYRETFNWKEVAWPLYEARDINQHSVGFTVLKARWKDSDQKVRVIEEVALWEGSCVLWGANANTPTQDVMKAWIESKRKHSAIPDRLARIEKSLRNGDYEGENHSLLKIELKYLEQAYYELEEKANRTSVIETDTANSKKYLDLLQSISSSL